MREGNASVLLGFNAVPSSASLNQELIQGVCEQSLPVLPTGAGPGGLRGSCIGIQASWVLFQLVSLISRMVGHVLLGSREQDEKI